MVSSWAMPPNTPLIDFFRRVYRPLKLSRSRTRANACRAAIDALAEDLGLSPTLGTLVYLDPPPPGLAELREYLVELGVSPPTHLNMFYRGKLVFVPPGEPTPQEIEHLTRQIREEWSEGEERVRAGKIREEAITWEPPQCAVIYADD
ncbi:MAG: hypothetical protein HYV60_23715 [Planctomycetia bacterium]|nr:hypothetical protein [Planctomycetia bacterium]